MNQPQRIVTSELIFEQEQSRHDYEFPRCIPAFVSDVADRLREAMADEGVDQSALAEAVGVTQGAISLILRGKTRQSKFLPDIAIELGVSYDWLVGKDVDKHSDRPVDVNVTPDEFSLIEQLRGLPFSDRRALQQVTSGFIAGRRPITDVTPELPSENALADMFEALLLSIDRDQPVDEVARELAQLLPTGLAQLQGRLLELPRPPRRSVPARPAAVEAAATAEPEHQR